MALPFRPHHHLHHRPTRSNQGNPPLLLSGGISWDTRRDPRQSNAILPGRNGSLDERLDRKEDGIVAHEGQNGPGGMARICGGGEAAVDIIEQDHQPPPRSHLLRGTRSLPRVEKEMCGKPIPNQELSIVVLSSEMEGGMIRIKKFCSNCVFAKRAIERHWKEIVNQGERYVQCRYHG